MLDQWRGVQGAGRDCQGQPGQRHLAFDIQIAHAGQLQLPGVRYLDIEGQMPLARLALAVAPGALDTAPLVQHLWALAEVL